MSLPTLVTGATASLLAAALLSGTPAQGHSAQPLSVVQYENLADLAQRAYAEGGSRPRLVANTRALALSSELFAAPLSVVGCRIMPAEGRRFAAVCRARNASSTQVSYLVGTFRADGQADTFAVSLGLSAISSEGP